MSHVHGSKEPNLREDFGEYLRAIVFAGGKAWWQAASHLGRHVQC